MASAIRPLRNRRRTAQRGKPMTQSQRWGKVVTTMTPIPGGEITSTETWVEDTQPATEEDNAVADAIVAEIEEELDQA